MAKRIRKINSLRTQLPHSTATHEGEVAKQPRLFRRGGKWTFRARVPDDLQKAVGRKEVWKSFGDVSHAEAVRLARIESVKLDEMFALARTSAAQAPKSDPSDAELQHVARAYLHRLEVSAAPMPFDDEERQERREAAIEESILIGQTIEDASLQGVAAGVARDARLSVQVGTAAFMRLAEAVQRALVEHYRREADRADLIPEKTGDPLFVGVTRDGPAPVQPLTLERAIALYLSDPERQGISPRTKSAYDLKFKTLKALLGEDRPINKIERADIRDVRDVLMRLPPHTAKRFPGQPLREVAEMAHAKRIEPMAPKNVVMHVELMSSLFKWLCREELADRNVAEGIGLPELPEETPRRPFTVDELNTLFSAPAFCGANGGDWFYWLPRVALFTGARFTEILGLKAADVVEQESVWMFEIKPNEFRSLKTKSSRRLVPVHPELVRLGLLKHAASVPSDGLLFPDAAGPANMDKVRNQQMGRAIRAVIADKEIVFHSLRHAFKDAAERADIAREHIAAIGGWNLPGGRVAMDAYGRAKHATKLAAEIAKLHFPGLNLRPASEGVLPTQPSRSRTVTT